jgi:hypothetical protein
MRTKNTARTKRHVFRSINRRRSLIGGLFLAVLFGAVAIGGPWGGQLRQRGIVSRVFYPSPAATPSPSKEYIYAGGRLIATEEPTSSANPSPGSLAAPANLLATTVSDVRIDVTWNANPNAHHYQVERSDRLGNPFTILNSNVTTTTFNDFSVVAVKAYLYRVLAVDAAGNLSPASNIDLATAVNFEDDPLVTGMEVKARHYLQLRDAIVAVRTAANLGAVILPNPEPGSVIGAIHIEALRYALDQALSALGRPTGGYTDSSLTGRVIQKIHIQELRDRVK